MARRSYQVKRKRTDRSRSRTSAVRRRLFPRRTLALVSRAVGLGTSATTVLRTSFFKNCANPAFYAGYLAPGSCYNPCGDQAAIQPQMFDQFSAMYHRYRVVKCTIQFTVSGIHGGGDAYKWMFAAFPAVETQGLNNYEGFASQQYAKTMTGNFASVLDVQNNAYVGLGAEPKTCWFKLTSDGVVGVRTNAYNNGANVGGNPPNRGYMLLPFCVQPNVNILAPHTGTFIIEVNMWQTVVFSEKKNVVDA